MNLILFIIPITNKSPTTVITVVEVVGVNPRGQISLGFPVNKHSLDTLAKGLSLFPVKEIKGIPLKSLFANKLNSKISLVLPEFDIKRSN